jgi:hypothetical protein
MSSLFSGGFRGRRAALIAVEHVLIVLSVILAAIVRLGLPDGLYAALEDWGPRAVFVALVLQICLHYGDLYDMRTLVDRRDLLTGLLRSVGAASVILAVMYFWVPSLVIGRGVFALATILIVALVVPSGRTHRAAAHCGHGRGRGHPRA